jgi:hypothetical protein
MVSYAKINVNVDLSKPIHKSILIKLGGKIQSLDYGVIPFKYNGCH